MSETLRQKILGAVARGWCHPKNSHKVMDVDLAEAITWEVLQELQSGGDNGGGDIANEGEATGAGDYVFEGGVGEGEDGA